jgi:3-dehydroquinate dehydratase type I
MVHRIPPLPVSTKELAPEPSHTSPAMLESQLSTPGGSPRNHLPSKPRVSSQAREIQSRASTPASVGTSTQQDKFSSLRRMMASPARTFDQDASLVLVGIRGCGKRSLGFIAATALNRRYITEDHYFEEVTGLSRQDYLRKHGNQEFHQQEIRVLQMMLDNNKSKCVIECGLGSLTKGVQEHLRNYSLTNPVVYVLRDMAQIQQLLKVADHTARLLENGDPTHRLCSNFEYFNMEDFSSHDVEEGSSPDRRSPSYSFKLKDAKEDFTHFVRLITGANTYRSNYDSPFSLFSTPTESRLYTHAIQIRSSDLENGRVGLDELESGGDAIELCIDWWTPDMLKMISVEVAMIRRKIGLPIVFSIDRDFLNDFPSAEDNYFSMVEHGLRLGVEFASVDLANPDRRIEAIVKAKGSTKIIGHFLDKTSQSLGGWDTEKCQALYERAEKLKCDLVRILQLAISREDNDAVRRFTERVRAQTGSHPPLIAYNVGKLGRTSQVFNTILTTVTHPAIERPLSQDADPQITSKDAVQALFQTFVLDTLHFYIVGASVSYSLSPAMHNAAYRICGMDHDYKTMDITSLADLDQLAKDPHFGGASVVQPWKVAIVKQLASKSRHAEAIGAVNTLLPLRALPDGSILPLQEQANQRNRAGRVAAWYGDNTDWIGIMICLNRNLSPRNVIKPLTTSGLVIGAGGMARAAIYAMLRLGCSKIFIFNRTLENAEAVAKHFNSWAPSASEPGNVVNVLRSEREAWPPNCAPPTMIVSCVPAHSIGGRPAANFEMPRQWLKSASGGVVIDVPTFLFLPFTLSLTLC